MAQNTMAVGNQKDFDRFMAAANGASPRLAVVMFLASWCGPCQMIKPKFEALPKSYPRALFTKVDIDEAKVFSIFEITSAMTQLLILSGSSTKLQN